MLTLYAVPVSLYCAKLRIVLRHKRLSFDELPPPGGYGSDEYKKLVPAGSLPALIHDGLQISDSEAIGEYLNEAFPDPDMLPGTPADRAKLRELSRFHDTRLEPVVRALFPHISANKRDKQFVEQQWQSLVERLDQIEVLLPKNKRSLTLADCGLPITAIWIAFLSAQFERENPMDGLLATYLENLGDHQAVAAEIESYQASLNAWQKTL
ncbi:MAG: glutathione S-transferase [Rhizobiaceae bacterium]|nr:glutathione S-transferase [Rhizobiaceae bacterium]